MLRTSSSNSIARTSSTNGGRPPPFSYDYHPLFRAFLLERATKSLATRELLEVQNSAAALLAANTLSAEAIELYLEAGNFGRAAEVRRPARRSPLYNRADGDHRVLAWEGCRESCMEQNGWLSTGSGLCQPRASPIESRSSGARVPLFRASGTIGLASA